jgi:hypothetical protein
MKLHKIPVVAPLLTPALAAGIGGGGLTAALQAGRS